MPGVFHPGMFFSSRMLLDHLQTLDLRGKRFLEIGTGSGLIAICAARKGAEVTATDVNPTAVENARSNATRNGVSVTFHVSDVWDRVPPGPFDVIAVNPPYYPRAPDTWASYAWRCGERYEFFDKFFRSLDAFSNPTSRCFMCLSEASPVEQISKIAEAHTFMLRLTISRRVRWEMNFVFDVIHTQAESSDHG
jgi:release factor glutamine methyltransferase